MPDLFHKKNRAEIKSQQLCSSGENPVAPFRRGQPLFRHWQHHYDIEKGFRRRQDQLGAGSADLRGFPHSKAQGSLGSDRVYNALRATPG